MGLRGLGGAKVADAMVYIVGKGEYPYTVSVDIDGPVDARTFGSEVYVKAYTAAPFRVLRL